MFMAAHQIMADSLRCGVRRHLFACAASKALPPRFAMPRPFFFEPGHGISATQCPHARPPFTAGPASLCYPMDRCPASFTSRTRAYATPTMPMSGSPFRHGHGKQATQPCYATPSFYGWTTGHLIPSGHLSSHLYAAPKGICNPICLRAAPFTSPATRRVMPTSALPDSLLWRARQKVNPSKIDPAPDQEQKHS